MGFAANAVAEASSKLQGRPLGLYESAHHQQLQHGFEACALLTHERHGVAFSAVTREVTAAQPSDFFIRGGHPFLLIPSARHNLERTIRSLRAFASSHGARHTDKVSTILLSVDTDSIFGICLSVADCFRFVRNPIGQQLTPFLLIPHQSRDAVLHSNGRFAPRADVRGCAKQKIILGASR
jgi:hypothetical protein